MMVLEQQKDVVVFVTPVLCQIKAPAVATQSAFSVWPTFACLAAFAQG